jgi:hypothetical protein
MLRRKYSPEEILRRGQALYEREIRREVEAENRGKFVIINIDTGEYEMDADDIAAAKRATARFGNAPQVVMRVGYPAAYYLGAHHTKSRA